MLAGVVLTVAAPFIPPFAEDFAGRREIAAHRNARPIRPVSPRPRPSAAPRARTIRTPTRRPSRHAARRAQSVYAEPPYGEPADGARRTREPDSLDADAGARHVRAGRRRPTAETRPTPAGVLGAHPRGARRRRRARHPDLPHRADRVGARARRPRRGVRRAPRGRPRRLPARRLGRHARLSRPVAHRDSVDGCSARSICAVARSPPPNCSRPCRARQRPARRRSPPRRASSPTSPRAARTALREQAERFDGASGHDIRVPSAHLDEALAGARPGGARRARRGDRARASGVRRTGARRRR